MALLPKLPAPPIEPSHAQRKAQAAWPRPPITIVVLDALGDYEAWARRHPEIDAIPYVVGQPMGGIRADRIEIDRGVSKLVEWALIDLGCRLAPKGVVHFEEWPAST